MLSDSHKSLLVHNSSTISTLPLRGQDNKRPFSNRASLQMGASPLFAQRDAALLRRWPHLLSPEPMGRPTRSATSRCFVNSCTVGQVASIQYRPDCPRPFATRTSLLVVVMSHWGFGFHRLWAVHEGNTLLRCVYRPLLYKFEKLWCSDTCIYFVEGCSVDQIEDDVKRCRCSVSVRLSKVNVCKS